MTVVFLPLMTVVTLPLMTGNPSSAARFATPAFPAHRPPESELQLHELCSQWSRSRSFLQYVRRPRHSQCADPLVKILDGPLGRQNAVDTVCAGGVLQERVPEVSTSVFLVCSLSIHNAVDTVCECARNVLWKQVHELTCVNFLTMCLLSYDVSTF